MGVRAAFPGVCRWVGLSPEIGGQARLPRGESRGLAVLSFSNAILVA